MRRFVIIKEWYPPLLCYRWICKEVKWWGKVDVTMSFTSLENCRDRLMIFAAPHENTRQVDSVRIE